MLYEPEVTGEEPVEPTSPEETDVDESAEEEVVVELVPEPDPLEKAQEELKATQARLRTVSKAYTDLQGEMGSYKKRAEAQAGRRAVKQTADLVRAMLEPIENLRRSVESPGDDLDALVGGLKLLTQQFADAMNTVGLKQTGKVGDLFDPRRHEALAMTPIMDKTQDGRILMVQTTGYVLGDNVLQPAQVIVGKYSPPPPPEPEEAAEEEQTEEPQAQAEQADAGDDEVDA